MFVPPTSWNLKVRFVLLRKSKVDSNLSGIISPYRIMFLKRISFALSTASSGLKVVNHSWSGFNWLLRIA